MKKRLSRALSAFKLMRAMRVYGELKSGNMKEGPRMIKESNNEEQRYNPLTLVLDTMLDVSATVTARVIDDEIKILKVAMTNKPFVTQQIVTELSEELTEQLSHIRNLSYRPGIRL
jgi:hypothetical protein